MRYILIAICMLVIPSFMHASVEITEIMYDLEGADAGAEWIEVYNSGADVDLTQYRFFEADTNHHIQTDGDSILPSGAYAVIADDPGSLSYSGLVFDSTFSLSNTGELLEIRNSELETVDSVTYSSAWGAAGTGESLQLSVGSWVARTPTPGEGVSAAEEDTSVQEDDEEDTPSDDDETQSPSTSSSDTQQSVKVERIPPKLIADAGDDRRVLAGTVVSFSGEALNEKGEPEEGVSYAWNFGDGGMAEGRKATHIFHDPGRYAVVLYVNENFMNMRDTDEVVVEVEKPAIEISNVSFGEAAVTLANNTSLDVDLSGWQIMAGGHSYPLPDFTRVLAGASVTLRLNQPAIPRGNVALKLPSGQYASTYENKVQHVSYTPTPVVPETQEKEEEVAVRLMQAQATTSTSSLAAAGTTVPRHEEKESSLLSWLLGVAGLAAVAGVSSVAIRRDRETT